MTDYGTWRIPLSSPRIQKILFKNFLSSHIELDKKRTKSFSSEQRQKGKFKKSVNRQILFFDSSGDLENHFLLPKFSKKILQ